MGGQDPEAGVMKQECWGCLDTLLRGDGDLSLRQGASRGLQLLAATDLPLFEGIDGPPGRTVPMLTLTSLQGNLSTEVVEVPVWRLPLPEGERLELVRIHGGTYRIGAEKGEMRRELCQQVYANTPGCRGQEHQVEEQRMVHLKDFALARHPITLGQWKAVAALPKLSEDLDPEPVAGAADASLPVVNVSWNDLQEWCGRLNQHLRQAFGASAPRLGLASEAQWEVACRAGGRSAFHFGDTIHAHWANVDGTYAWPPGQPPSGVNLGRTTPVGAYGHVNGWGLADMHGNVWEWCQDRWHPRGSEGPDDGSPRERPARGLNPFDRERRLLRGGSWYDDPVSCRSACRNGDHPDYRLDIIGFRVCCLPPGSASTAARKTGVKGSFGFFSLFPQGAWRWQLIRSPSLALARLRRAKNFPSPNQTSLGQLPDRWHGVSPATHGPAEGDEAPGGPRNRQGSAPPTHPDR